MKSGIDYFPLDVALDSKMELIEAEFGMTGFGVVVKLLAEIYGKQGYYIEWTEEVALLFARKIGLGGSVVSEIVSASIKRGMFDQEIFNKYRILTSRGIQRRYFEAVYRRKEIEVNNNILLVDATQICKGVNIRHKNDNISSKNDDISKQSKVEESKEEKSKVKDSNGAKTRLSNPVSKGKDAFSEFAAGNCNLLAALQGFAEMRKAIKKPLTDRAKTMIIAKLLELSNDRSEQIEILDQSTCNNWQGIFPLKRDTRDDKRQRGLNSESFNERGKESVRKTETTNAPAKQWGIKYDVEG